MVLQESPERRFKEKTIGLDQGSVESTLKRAGEMGVGTVWVGPQKDGVYGQVDPDMVVGKSRVEEKSKGERLLGTFRGRKWRERRKRWDMQERK